MSILDYQNIVTAISISSALIEQLQLLLHTKNYSETSHYAIAYYFLLSSKELYINNDFYLHQHLAIEERHTKKNYPIRFAENLTDYLTKIYKNPEKYSVAFGLTEHKKLAKLLCSIKRNFGNDFIYFCRITVTRKKDKQNKIISNTKELEILNRDLKETINDLYYNHGLYYLDVEWDNGIIEKIITSFPFKNATPY